MFKIVKTLLMCIASLITISCNAREFDPVKNSYEATTPYMNYLFASNASFPGRVYMTFTGPKHKPCINTATSFYNKYHTCSNCEDFIKSPETWDFVKVTEPKVGDMLIQHSTKTGRAYHAAIIVDIRNGKYVINHAVRTKYYKDVLLQNDKNLTFYRHIKCL